MEKLLIINRISKKSSVCILGIMTGLYFFLSKEIGWIGCKINFILMLIIMVGFFFKKIQLNWLDNSYFFILIIYWAGLISIFGKSEFNALVIAPQIIGVSLILYYARFLILPNQLNTKKISKIWIIVSLLIISLIHVLIPPFPS